MRFTLHYEGPLKPKGSAQDKQAIRDALEDQLKELWTYPPLNFGNSRLLRRTQEDFSIFETRFGHTFAPIVSEKTGLRAELDILMLRPSAPGQIVVGGGDIDNRLKTLFDALSAPQQAQQVTADVRESSDDDPIFVLLDDDDLITRVNVETDRLLNPPSQDIVRLFIRVTTWSARPTYLTQTLGS